MNRNKKSYIQFLIFVSIFLLLVLLYVIFIYSNKRENFEGKTSFHVLIATIGKNSIFRLLDSFNEQFTENDYITIVFDGPDWPNIQEVQEYTEDFKCNVSVIVEEKNLGYWGHAIRNKHKDLNGDFVFHVDDDDNITPDCIKILRNHCTDKNKVFVFKMKLESGEIVWKEKKLVFSEIGTPMGILPIEINKKADFGYFYGGDHAFYKSLEDQGISFEFVDKLIYIVRPKE
jgi:hypothetical protein